MAEINLKEGYAIAADGSKMYWNGTEYQDHIYTPKEQIEDIIKWYEEEKEILKRLYKQRFDSAINGSQVIRVNEWYEESIKRIYNKFVEALLNVTK